MQSHVRNSRVRELVGHLDFFGVECRNIGYFAPIVEPKINTLVTHAGFRLP